MMVNVLLLALFALASVSSQRTCASTSPYVGGSTAFTSLHNGVKGVITINNDCEMEISKFSYDGKLGDYKIGVWVGKSPAALQVNGERVALIENRKQTDVLLPKFTLPSEPIALDFSTAEGVNTVSIRCEDCPDGPKDLALAVLARKGTCAPGRGGGYQGSTTQQDFTLTWKTDCETEFVTFTLSKSVSSAAASSRNFFLGMAFNKDYGNAAMGDTDQVILLSSPSSGKLAARDGRVPLNTVVSDTATTSFAWESEDSFQHTVPVGATVSGNTVTFVFRRRIAPGNLAVPFNAGDLKVRFFVNQQTSTITGARFQLDGTASPRGTTVVNFLTTNPFARDVSLTLLNVARAVHAFFMLFAFTVMMPASWFASNYVGQEPFGWPRSWHFVAVVSILCGFVAAVVAVLADPSEHDHFYDGRSLFSAHGILGLFVIVFALLHALWAFFGAIQAYDELGPVVHSEKMDATDDPGVEALLAGQKWRNRLGGLVAVLAVVQLSLGIFLLQAEPAIAFSLFVLYMLFVVFGMIYYGYEILAPHAPLLPPPPPDREAPSLWWQARAMLLAFGFLGTLVAFAIAYAALNEPSLESRLISGLVGYCSVVALVSLLVWSFFWPDPVQPSEEWFPEEGY